MVPGLLLVALAASATVTPSTTASAPCGAGRSAAVASEFLREINALREKHNLSPMRLHSALCDIAQERAREITESKKQEFDLLSDEELFRRADAAGYNARYIAELEIQAEVLVSSVVSEWAAKLGNAALEGKATHLGVGVGHLGGLPLYVLFFGLSQEVAFDLRAAPLADREMVMGEMLDRVNRERRKAQLNALRLHHALERAAQTHAEDMLTRSFYSHATPEGKDPIERVRAAGYAPASVAHNVARGQFSVGEVIDEWMRSGVHRAAIFGRRYKHVGFGLAYGVNESGPTVVWVQIFATPVRR